MVVVHGREDRVAVRSQHHLGVADDEGGAEVVPVAGQVPAVLWAEDEADIDVGRVFFRASLPRSSRSCRIRCVSRRSSQSTGISPNWAIT